MYSVILSFNYDILKFVNEWGIIVIVLSGDKNKVV